MTIKRAKQLILHLGLAKTGSSSPQRVFYEQRNTLLTKHEVLYLGFQENHNYLAAMFSRQPELLPQIQRLGFSGRTEIDIFLQKMRGEIIQEVTAKEPQRIIVSSEYFTAMSVCELQSLYSFFGSIAEEVLPIAYLRDPWSFTTSLVQEMIRSGTLSKELSFGYARSNIEIFNKFEEAFKTTITVVPYCGGKHAVDVVADFAHRFGISVEDGASVNTSPRTLNAAMSREAASVMLHLNRQYPAISPAKDWVVEALQAADSKTTKLTISRDTAEAIFRDAKSDLAAIEEKYFAGQPVFSEYYNTLMFDSFDDTLTLSGFSPTHIVEFMLNALNQLSSRALYYHDRMKISEAERLYWNGKYLAHVGKLDHARSVLLEALSYQPDHSVVLSELASISDATIDYAVSVDSRLRAGKSTRKILVVGATGYIGKELLVEADKTFDAIGTSTIATEKTIALDLATPSYFYYDLIQDSDIVLLAAAISSPDICSNDEIRARQINVVGTIEFIKKIVMRGGRVIFFSSDVVYGESSLASETTPCNPAGKYAMMKHEVESYFSSEPLFKSIRLSYVFSRNDKFTSYLSSCSNRNLTAELFHPFFRSVIYKSDVIEGVLALARNWELFPQRVINFGGPELLSRVDIAGILRQIAFTNLQYNQVTPDSAFFLNRPKVIALSSSVLHELLRRPAMTLADAARIEFPLAT